MGSMMMVQPTVMYNQPVMRSANPYGASPGAQVMIVYLQQSSCVHAHLFLDQVLDKTTCKGKENKDIYTLEYSSQTPTGVETLVFAVCEILGELYSSVQISDG